MSEAIATKLEELGNLYYDTGDTEVGLSLKELAHSPDRARSLRSALLENTSLYTTNKHLENSIESSSHNPSQQLLESIISTDNKRLSKYQIHRILDVTRLWDRDPQGISYLKVMISKWSTEPSSFYGQLMYEHKPNQISLLKLCIEQFKQIEDEAKVNSIRRKVILVIIFEAVKKEEQELLRKSKIKKRTLSTANYTQPFRSQAIDALAHRLWDSQKVSPKDFSLKRTRLLRMARFGEKWSVIKPAGLILGLGGNSQSFELKKWSILEIQAINELLCTFKLYSLLPTLEAAFQTIKSVQQNDHYSRWDAIPPLPNPHPPTTGREPAINANPANFNSNPISIDALLNPADYIAGSTQSQQLAIARNSPIQITNGAVLSGYGQDSTAGEHAEFGSSKREKRGLESLAEADDLLSQRKRFKTNPSHELEFIYSYAQKEKLASNLQEPFPTPVIAEYHPECIRAMFPYNIDEDVRISIIVNNDEAAYKIIETLDLQKQPQGHSPSLIQLYSNMPKEKLWILGDLFSKRSTLSRRYRLETGPRSTCVSAFASGGSGTDDNKITFFIMVDQKSGSELANLFGMKQDCIISSCGR
ncbi:hypothetical protein SBOR_10041 [Sclerotinia borealis F-4128]|uniref:Uncharacterized protein n=1 Tax=Sclerotinia borealis (strain F-4128) TaxID=1432307 RepID=W9BY97_SCLBF|nr:hypothetical protein SBOR_10041 [Sclerotinia borealis F-4128]